MESGYTKPGTAALAVNGKVGIGTNIPIGLLNVSGDSAGQALVNFNYTGSGTKHLYCLGFRKYGSCFRCFRKLKCCRYSQRKQFCPFD